VRTSILLWSTASGVILGVFIDATLIGIALLLGTVLPFVSSRLHQRWLLVSAACLLAAIPVILAVLGYLEGQLKTL
jgi:hypothetical protein